ncbi:YdaU family protein [Pseudomonas kitaguniensis]|uniref:YdaU family protein n=1 Tax=Pseudomonas kitaguniensis TaxID=2607908 RepID=UPI003D082A6E
MAALPYMQLYVADYLADTMHLTTEEHGAYLLLIFNYWQTGKPIPVARLSRIARLTNDRWADVERTLNEFFNERDGEWTHERIERDLEALHATQAQRIAAGKASAEARKNAAKTRSKAPRNDRSTPVKISLNENSTNKEEKRREENIQDQKHLAPAPVKSRKFDPLTAKPSNVSPEVWADWCQHRREIHKPLTAKSCEQQAKALEEHANPEQVIVKSIAGGWAGLFPEKVTGTVHQLPSRHTGFSDRDYKSGLIEREDGTYAF